MSHIVGGMLPQYFSATWIDILKLHLEQRQPRGGFSASFSDSWNIWVLFIFTRVHVTSATEQKPRMPHTPSAFAPPIRCLSMLINSKGVRLSSVSTCLNS